MANGAIDPYAFLAEAFDAAAGGWVGVDGMPRFDRGTTSVTFQAPHVSKFRLRYAGLGVDFYFQYEVTSLRGHFLIKYYCPTAVTCVLPPASRQGVTNYFPLADAD